MNTERNKSGFSYWTVISIILISSCQSGHNKKSINQVDTIAFVDSNVNTEAIQEPDTTKPDTLTVQDRRLEGGDIHSHIKLDFAKLRLK